MDRIPVTLLGATGMVGQRLVQLLLNHPQFRVGRLCASSRSVGKAYSDAATWRLEGDLPAHVAGQIVAPCVPEGPPGVALSALPSDTARDVEAAFRAAGWAVVSNASAFRQDPDVPLVIPEVNADHLSLLDRQEGPGFIVTNPNCCAIPLALALAPLHARWPVQALCVSTWQAVSGAGYPGESAWDMVANVHPHPGAEEAKLAIEPARILGTADAPADFAVSARCVRVPVADGHLLSVQARLAGDPSPQDLRDAWASFDPGLPDLHSLPTPLFHVLDRRDRPQPRLDVGRGDGMAVTIGRVERCAVMGVKFYCLAHNTLRGAAGAAVANLELLAARGLLP